MISMVRSASGAEQAVRWAKFWPRGELGLNGGNRDGRFGLTPLPEYMAAANASTFLGIQIETAGALAGAAAIAAIPDVDLLFIGPSDLSQVLGVPGDFENSRCLEAIETIARTCAEANKPWGVFSRGPGYAERMRDLGCRLFVLASDIHTVHAGIRTAKERYELFFPGRRICVPARRSRLTAAAALAAAPPGPRRDSAASCRSWQVPRC
ncbi:MAG: aldolase/citrate lyase family protein, partial [Isosphaeraceae bacterium]